MALRAFDPSFCLALPRLQGCPGALLRRAPAICDSTPASQPAHPCLPSPQPFLTLGLLPLQQPSSPAWHTAIFCTSNGPLLAPSLSEGQLLFFPAGIIPLCVTTPPPSPVLEVWNRLGGWRMP